MYRNRTMVPRQLWTTGCVASLPPDSMLDGFHLALPFFKDNLCTSYPAVVSKAHNFAITRTSHQYTLIKAVVQSQLFKTKRNLIVKAYKIKIN